MNANPLVVRDVIVAKAEKIYAEGTALVVHVDDSLQIREPAHVAALEHLAISQLVPLLSRREFRVLNTTTYLMQHSDIIVSIFPLGDERCAGCKLRMRM